MDSTGGAGISEPRSRWQHIRHRLFVLGALIVLVALVYVVIRFGWGWTGFAGGYSQVTVKETTEDKVYLMSKTLWDWMQLLLVPVMLAIGGFWLNQRQKNRDERMAEQRDKAEREAAERRAQTDREIAADNQREAALQAYIDKIGELLLREHSHLGESPGDPQVENIARARTVTVLRVLDPGRRVSLLRFLSQAGILRLCTEGNLREIDLHDTRLEGFDLSHFNLIFADLSRADLSGANLSYVRLYDANLSGADLSGANLHRTNLSGASLFMADLSGANLIVADLSGTYLDKANLSGANLIVADLSGAEGLTDYEWADYKSRGALVYPVPSTPLSRSAASSAQQRDGEQGQSPTPVQAAETPPAAAGATPSMQEEDGADANSSGAPPTQPDSPS